jgi:hypothetical protein
MTSKLGNSRHRPPRPGTIPDAAARLVKGATLGPDGPTGQFFSDHNSPETGFSPW